MGVAKAQDHWPSLSLPCVQVSRPYITTSPQTCYLLTSPTCRPSGNTNSQYLIWLITGLKHSVFVALFQPVAPRKKGVIKPEVQSYIRIIKGTWCRKVNFNSAPAQQADRAGRQRKQNGCICFSCENQWAQTDGGLFPHYLLPGSLTNVLATPPGLTVHR